MLKLFTYFRSSAAYRVRIALNVKLLDYESIPIHFGRSEHRDDRYLDVNPQGLVPALEHDGNVVTQSLAIIEYLDSLAPSPQLIPAPPLERARVQAFAQAIACDTHPLNNLRVLKYLRGELGLGEPAVVDWYRHWIAESFSALERLAADQGTDQYCCGDALSLADVCLVPQVYNARRFGCDLSAYPRLVAIADGLDERDAFARAAPERQPDAD